MMALARDLDEAARNNPQKPDLASLKGSWGAGCSVGQESLFLGPAYRRALCQPDSCASQTAPARNGKLCPNPNALICAIPGNLLIQHRQATKVAWL